VRTMSLAGSAERVSAGARSGLAAWYRVGEFFVVRTPLLPVERMLEWQRCPARVTPTLESTAAESGLDLVHSLLQSFCENELRTALFFASPELYDLVEKLRRDGPVPVKVQRSLTRYFLRATGRETPFGLLAGNSIGRIGNDCFELAGRADYRSHTRISIAFLARMMADLGARPDLNDHILHEPNSGLSLVQGNYRLSLDEPDCSRSWSSPATTLIELTRTSEVDQVLELARPGRSLSAIAEAMTRPGLDFASLLDFCRALSARKILVPSWLPSITGTNTARVGIQNLQGNSAARSAHAVLQDTSRELEKADSGELGEALELYEAARDRLRGWKLDVDFPQPLQTELVKPAPRLRLSEELAERFLAAATLLRRISRLPPNPELAAFRERFAARYDRRLVPLTEALDADVGIGFGGNETDAAADLVADLPAEGSRESIEHFDPLDRSRLRLLESALRFDSQVVELDNQTLALFMDPEDSEPEAESIAIVAHLARRDDGGVQLVTPALVSHSVITLLGRFCEADRELCQAVLRHAQLEQALAGDTILADVVYSPGDETANVVARPVIRDYEITCGGKSGAPLDHRIPISDLLIGIEGHEIDLYSARLKKRVAIRFGNAHNYLQTSLPTVYRFLGALQDQGREDLSASWSWGTLQGSPFLPRIVHGDTILSLARWTISEREWAPVLAAPADQSSLRMQELRAERKLPRWLTRSDGDRRLTVDLENDLSVQELIHEARQRRSLSLEELLPTPDQLVVFGPEGSYASQFVVPFVRRTPVPARPLPEHLVHPWLRPARRCHVPGSDWLYAKIYAGRSRHTSILRRIRSQVIDPSIGRSLTQWFYLPFADPDPHLRVRFNGPRAELRNVVLARLEQALAPTLETGTVFRFELGTYEPEFERYGGAVGVEFAERLFFADSEATSQLLELVDDDHQLRWQVTLVGIDRLLCDFDADIEQRLELARTASDRYGSEAGATTATWRAIGDKYRSHSSLLTRMLWERPSEAPLNEVNRILTKRSERIRPLWHGLRGALESGAVRVPPDEPLPLTFAHLHAIRMLGIAGRSHELVLYEFLRRQYAALVSRKDSLENELRAGSA
jgi:lantibiotic biosynthesis protein